MKIKKNSKLLWLIHSSYGFKVNPQSLCSFFWITVSALIFIPMDFPFHVLNMIVKSRYHKAPAVPFGIAGYLISMLLGFAIGQDALHLFVIHNTPDFILLFIIPHLSLLIVSFILASIIGLIYWVIQGIIYLWNLIPKKEKDYSKIKEPNLFLEYAKAKKHKYCPLIKYEG